MILFSDDWRRYPTAIIDTSTKNKSFVRLASLYRHMEIQNHAFILALINPALQGVDPFDPNLSVEQMAMIALECRENPWYFIREVARAPGIASNTPSPLEANRGNIALFWCFFNHIMTILIQVRQTGKSFSSDVLVTLLMNIMCQNTQINLLTKDDVLRRRNIERLKEIALELPRYLQQHTREDANNGEELTIRSLGNSYITHVPQSSPKRAYNLGRGLTSPIFFVDEAPFQSNIAISLPAALAATGAAVDAAKRAGTPYGTILTTTAGKKDDKDGRFVFNLVNDSAIWTEKFFDAKDLEELEHMVKRNSRAGVCRINATFNHQQLGKTDAWLKEKLDESLQMGEDADRDFFNVWSTGTSSHPLSTDILEKIRKSVIQPLYTDISKPHAYITRWYIPEEEIEYRMRSSKFVMGMDTSEASGGDDISLVLLDVKTLEVVAAGTFNETNLITFSEWICSILVNFTNVTAIIERRSTGAMVLDYLLLMLPQHGVDPFKRLFNRAVNDYDEYQERWREVRQPMNRRTSDVYIRHKKTFGFSTSGAGITSRSELYSTTLQNAAKRSADRIRDKAIVDQIAGLVTRNGRIDHEEGEHDDMVIGLLLAHWLITLGKNLSHYDIQANEIMSLVVNKEETKIDSVNRSEQQHIRNRIEEISNLLSAERDTYISDRLEHELRLLDRKLILEEGEVFSLDALIKQVNEAKKHKQRSYLTSQQNIQQYNDPYMRQGTFSDVPMFGNDAYR